MRIGHFRKTSLHVHPLFPAICLTYLLGGQGKVLLIYLLTLFCHECGHILMACRFRLSVRRLELTPFGGSMQIDESETLPARQSLALSAGGVCVNALLLPPLIAGGAVNSDAPRAAVYALCFADPFAWMAADAVLLVPFLRNIMKMDYRYLKGTA